MPRSPLPCCIVVAALVLSNALPAAAQPTNPAKTTTAVTAPSAPVAVTASAGLAAEIDLSWSAPAPAPTGASTVARYIVQRGFSPSGAFATLFTTADATQTSFKDQGLPGSVSYHYRVVAVSSTGGQSPPSSPVKGTTAVATINDLGASPGVTSTSVSMTWSYVPGAAGYQVFKGPQGGPFTLIANLGSSFTRTPRSR